MLSALALVAALGLATAEQDQLAIIKRVEDLLARTPLIDGHNDLAWAIREHGKGLPAYDLGGAAPGHTDMARLRKGHVGGQLWSVYVPTEPQPGGHLRVQLEQIDLARAFIARYPQHLTLALTADELEQAFKNGRVGSLLAIEGGHVIDDSLAVLRAYHTLGVRAMTLTHTASTRWADAAEQPGKHGGLTPFGEAVVAEMNRLGMLVDLSHVADATMDDALRVSAAPVVFTHSNARALTDVPRNVPDELLRRLPANGGLVMATFVPSFTSQAVADARKQKLKKVPRATLAQVADHIEHIRDVAGVDHVGLGSDFDGMTAVPEGLEDVSTFPALLAELARRGWTDADLAKLAGGNFLRVLRRAEATAHALQATRGPSEATIDPRP